MNNPSNQAKRKLVILTGAGVSAESGISTFRDSDGLWENYPVHDGGHYKSLAPALGCA